MQPSPNYSPASQKVSSTAPYDQLIELVAYAQSRVRMSKAQYDRSA